MLLLILFLILPLLIGGAQGQFWPSVDEELSTINLIEKNISEVLRMRGYLASEFYFTTSEGYILNLVRANNPLINEGRAGGQANKSIVMFLSGANASGRCYIANSVGARPKNYGHLSADKMSHEELVKLLGNDPATNSVPLTLLNFGHEIWFMNRRGTFPSLGQTDRLRQAYKSPLDVITMTLFGGSPSWPHYRRRRQVHLEKMPSPIDAPLKWIKEFKLNLTSLNNSINPKFWNYSLDEQAIYDLPETVDFVLKQTGRKKLNLIGYSASGGLTLMSLAEPKAKLADKLLKAIVWSPAMDLGHKDREDEITMANYSPTLEPLFINVLGPVFPLFASPFIRITLTTYCALSEETKAECEKFMAIIGGWADKQLKFSPGNTYDILDGVGMREVTQMLQSSNKKAMHKFDFRNKERNMEVYGQPEPPMYQLESIQNFNGIVIYYGNTDALVTPADVKFMLKRFKVPVEAHLLGDSQVLFNHFSFVIHRNCSTLFVIPQLRTIEEADGWEQQLA